MVNKMGGNRRYLIGLGNYSKNDDGVGLRVVEAVVSGALDKGFEAIEAGNDGIKILTYFEPETERIVIVDCALMDIQAGEYKVFRPDDVVSNKITGRISTHEGDIMKIIELGKQLGCNIPDIRVLAIQPESLEMDSRLSPLLEKRLPEYVSVAVKTVLE